MLPFMQQTQIAGNFGEGKKLTERWTSGTCSTFNENKSQIRAGDSRSNNYELEFMDDGNGEGSEKNSGEKCKKKKIEEEKPPNKLSLAFSFFLNKKQ